MNIHKLLIIFLIPLLGFQIAAMQQANLQQRLITAAREGKNERVEELMLAGAPVAPEALAYPTMKGNYDVVKTIFECGVNPELPADPNQMYAGLTLFTSLVLNKVLQPQIKEKFILLYLKHGADIELRGPGGSYMLIDEVQNLDFNTLKLLLEQRAYVNEQNGAGYTALMILALQPVPLSQPKKYLLQRKKAKLLIEYGTDINLKHPIIGDTVLMTAARRGNKLLVELLLENGTHVSPMEMKLVRFKLR